jgi:hypothetical protein
MAEEGTLAIRADVLKFAGAKASGTSTAEAYTNVYIKMAEGFVCTASRYDWVTNYASVSTIGKEMLRNATAAYAAIKAIEYDMSGYTSKEEAQTMLDVLWSMVVECVNLLRDDKYREFVLNG